MPPIVRVPVRLAATVLAATCAMTVPAPEPVCPVESAIHAAFDAELQAQNAAVVTVNETGPPVPGTAALIGEIVYVQLPGVWPRKN